MGFFSRIFGGRHRYGVNFDPIDGWEISLPTDPAVFLRKLPVLFPNDCFVYFEGTTDRAFAKWLKIKSVQTPSKVGLGTIVPKPDYYHIPLEPELLAEAADIVDDRGISFPSVHVHVHDATEVLLYWHDAFCDDPMLLAKSVSSDRILEFAKAIGSTAAQGKPNRFTDNQAC